MKSLFKKSNVPQNLSLIDRVVRLVLGLVMISVLFFDNPYFVLSTTWMSVLVLVSIYPLMTGMLGVDPLYAAAHVKSCDTSEHNQCGTLPYQAAAATDHIPGVCDDETEHSCRSHRPYSRRL